MNKTPRAIGYSKDTAIVDVIIDNTISAEQRIFGFIIIGKVQGVSFQF